MIKQILAGKQPLIPVGDLKGYFWVPAYQRGYRWGKHEVEALLNDLQACAKLPTGQSYCLQPVVIKARTQAATDPYPDVVPVGETFFELVDGQQRVTTLYLLYRYLHKLGQTTPTFALCYETRPGSTQFLKAVSSRIDDTNIDYFHMSTAFVNIQKWFETQWPDGIERRIAAADWSSRLASQIKLIWFDAGQQDAIDLFTRINAGRIALTNAELVKALLLADHGNADPIQQATCAGQWDAIEHALHDDAFWYFLSIAKPESYATRIDLLLDLIARTSRTGNDSFHTFEWFHDKLAQGKTQQDLWGEVWQRYSQLRDWFEDRAIYHRIGWLIATGERLSVVMDKCLQNTAQSRSAFKKILDDHIRERLAIAKQDLDGINYENHRQKCERLLLLFNVLSVDRFELGNERYPFATHHKEQWSLEHIHAQAAQPLNGEGAWREWLSDAKMTLDSLRLDDIKDREKAKRLTTILDKALSGKLISGEEFQKLEARISEFLNRLNATSDLHALDNLALLSGDINTALGNLSFPAKRQRLLLIDKVGHFIPPCTRRVFLKYYTDTADQQLQLWSQQDRDAYRDVIAKIVAPYLNLGKQP
jgi:hypothetical protein